MEENSGLVAAADAELQPPPRPPGVVPCGSGGASEGSPRLSPRHSSPCRAAAESADDDQPDIRVWTSFHFMSFPTVKADAGAAEGDGVVHRRMESGWDVDLRAEPLEPPSFKPGRFVEEWLMTLTAPVPQIIVALFRACKGDPSPLRVFDGHRATKEDAADRGTIERGKRSGRIYIFAGIPIFAARFIPVAYAAFFFEQLQEAQLVPLLVVYVGIFLVLVNQVSAKIAMQPVAANQRLQSAFERRKNEFLPGWCVAALDVMIFELRLAAARTGLGLDEPLRFECSVDRMRQFLLPVLHTIDRAQPNSAGRRPLEDAVLELIEAQAEGQRLESDALARLDKSGAVCACKGPNGEPYCSVPAKLVALRLIWHAVTNDGSYRQAVGRVHSNAAGGWLGLMAQMSIFLTVILMPHLTRWWQEELAASASDGLAPSTLNGTQKAFCIVTAVGFVITSNVNCVQQRHLSCPISRTTLRACNLLQFNS